MCGRDRVLDGDIAGEFFELVLARARRQRLLSRDHFTVDGTLVEAWASHQSFRSKDDPDDDGSSFRGQKRKNETHASTTDPECRLMRKGRGKEARLAYQVNVLLDNRNGLIVGAEVLVGDGAAETEGALRLLERVPGNHRATVGADKLYDNKSFVDGARALMATPHVIQNTKGRQSRIDGRTTRHQGPHLEGRQVRLPGPGAPGRCQAPTWNRRSSGRPTPGLRDERQRETSGRRSVRLDEAGRSAAPSSVPRPQEDELGHGLERRRLQHSPNSSP